MDKQKIRSVIISTDPAFRAFAHSLLEEAGRGIPVVLEIPLPFQEIGTPDLMELRRLEPDLVLLDLESDPALGVRFAHFLAERNPSCRLLAVGPALGPEMLLEAMRAGISEYLLKPVAEETLSAALDRLSRKLAPVRGATQRQPGEVIAVFSPKGGSGSTTVATNLAVHLHQLTGKRTLLVDLDLELGEAAVHLGMQPRFSFVDLIRNFHRLDSELLASYIERHDTGVHLLSAPFHPEPAETVTPEAIRRILHFLKENYEYVVVDAPKSFGPSNLATLGEAERILLVTTVDMPSLRNVKRCLPMLDRVTGGAGDRVRLVVNRYDPDDPIGLDEVKTALSRDVYWTLSNDYESVIRAINSGKPAVLNTKSTFVRDLMALTADVSGMVAKNGQRSRFGAIQRLFAKKQPSLTQEGLSHG